MTISNFSSRSDFCETSVAEIRSEANDRKSTVGSVCCTSMGDSFNGKQWWPFNFIYDRESARSRIECSIVVSVEIDIALNFQKWHFCGS
jgi:hypothetical protein